MIYYKASKEAKNKRGGGGGNHHQYIFLISYINSNILPFICVVVFVYHTAGPHIM